MYVQYGKSYPCFEDNYFDTHTHTHTHTHTNIYTHTPQTTGVSIQVAGETLPNSTERAVTISGVYIHNSKMCIYKFDVITSPYILFYVYY